MLNDPEVKQEGEGPEGFVLPPFPPPLSLPPSLPLRFQPCTGPPLLYQLTLSSQPKAEIYGSHFKDFSLIITFIIILEIKS